MRIALCFRWQRQVYRLMWFNESSQGLFWGIAGTRDKDVHHSYHKDGRRHDKANGQLIMEPFFHEPIDSVRGVHQLVHASISITPAWFNAKTAYVTDEKTGVVIMLHDSAFPVQRCGLDVLLLDRGSEPQLHERTGSDRPNFLPVAELVYSLDHFRRHKVALVLHAEVRE